MPFTHHSHSGEFCEGHAKNQLEEVVQEAVRQNMQVLAMTEHMPRDQPADLYPEENEAGVTNHRLSEIFDRFHAKARQLQNKYASEITLLVGVEIDWIRPSSQEWIESLLEKHQLDLFIGSVHHVHGIPIDYSPQMYLRALAVSSSNAQAANIPAQPEEMLFADYYDAQYAMLQALRPPIVGHFDLIRLLSEHSNETPKTYSRVWRKILRNLLFIKEYGGLLEINSAAVRKGLHEPYPQRQIVERFTDMGGKLCLSDDSHGISQIGWGYKKVLNWLEKVCGVNLLTIFEKSRITKDPRFPGIGTRELYINNLYKHSFFSSEGAMSSEIWGLEKNQYTS